MTKKNHWQEFGRRIEFWTALFLTTLAVSVLSAAESGENHFLDPDFRDGFVVVDGPKTLGELRPNSDRAPFWTLAQHNSRFNLTQAELKTLPNGGYAYETPGVSIAVSRTENGESTLALNAAAENEYAAPRVMNQPWVHLLTSCNFPEDKLIPIEENTPLIFSVDLKIVRCENKMSADDYNQGLHCGQVSAYFVVKNANPNSPDHHDYIWFGFPIYDSRYEVIAPYAALDGDPAILGTGKLIWLPGGQEALDRLYGGKNPRSGEWVHLEGNLNDYLAEALAEAKRRNFLTHTSLDELKVAHFNLGWEVPGTFHCEMELKNPSLKVKK